MVKPLLYLILPVFLVSVLVLEWASLSEITELILPDSGSILRASSSAPSHNNNQDYCDTLLNSTMTPLSTSNLPPISCLINDTDITSNVDFLLHHVIIGHAKTGTTETQAWLNRHPAISMPVEELFYQKTNQSKATIIEELYELEPGKKWGFKKPSLIYSPKFIQNLEKHFPSAKLIVGIRHPVLWFQSFYSYRIHNGETMPPAETLETCKVPGSNGVCVHRARFHNNLSLLGKTNCTVQEIELLHSKQCRRHPSLTNKVFLYEVSQLQDSNKTRSDRYRFDLSNFLQLKSTPLPPLNDEPYVKNRSKDDLNICEERYKDIRDKLMVVARDASLWIRTYFIPHNHVTISSPDYFNDLLLSWNRDPCMERDASL